MSNDDQKDTVDIDLTDLWDELEDTSLGEQPNEDTSPPSSMVYRRPLGLKSRNSEDPEEIPVVSNNDAIEKWKESQRTPTIPSTSTIHEDLFELQTMLVPFLHILRKFHAQDPDDLVLFRRGQSQITLKDLRRMKNAEMRIRLIRMAVQSLEARVQSSTDPGFLKSLKNR